MAPVKSGQSLQRRRWRAADAHGRRDLVIDAAMDLLTHKGPSALTMRRVADRLGVGTMTLYTYVRSHEQLRRELTHRGFAMLNTYCVQHTTLGSAKGWHGGAIAYVKFAIENPALYELMFSTPYEQQPEDLAILEGGFSQLLEKVTARFAQQGMTGRTLKDRSRTAAGRMWIALHGLASLAIAGRLTILGSKPEPILDDLLPLIQPDDGR
ncbi:MAG: TetR family transcriptional regulator [Phycisphaera sp.]|nr:TetR family transcriptional regulator [Phycisphaera sp.]